ncbi:MAG: T9SS type A sorting domain-containing protein [Aquaticitalea sp.]
MKKILLFITFISFSFIGFSQTTYTVNSPADLPDININDNVCIDASGNCTLRAAIQNANKTANKDIIEFDILGNAPFTIVVTDVMQPIEQPIIIDGRTQLNYINSPIIEIDGSNLPVGKNGLQLIGSSTGSEIYGLSIGGFKRLEVTPFTFGFGILANTGNHIIQSNYIGLKPDGTTINSNTGTGILFNNTGGNFVGGASPNQGNVISGNGSGLLFEGTVTNSSATNNTVQGNLIGTDATGTLNKGNRFNLTFIDAPNNVVGGSSTGARNIISGANSSVDTSVGTGIAITGNESYGNAIIGNYIGTDITGTQSISNVRGGILMLFGANNNDIGTDIAGEGNVISGNGQYGVYLQGDAERPVVSNSIKGNYIGVDATGTMSLSNSAGVAMFFGVNNNNTIGGTTPNSKNVISGNSAIGIGILNGINNQIIGNYIGTNASGTSAVANNFGIFIDGGDNIVGGQGSASRNIISGNSTGLEIGHNATIGTVVKGNYIGLNALGTAAIPNATGISLLSTSTNSIIGGINALDRNIISGNSSFGISVGGSSHNIKNNYIGLNPAGTSAVPNTIGISFISTATNNTIGGATASDRNIISGNSNIGIDVSGTSHTIQNNYIGLNPGGTSVIKNNNIGMRLAGTLTNTQVSENTISGNGTTSSSARNVDFTSANGAQFFSNKVGTLANGNTGVVNVGVGITLNNSNNNRIGGDTELEGNIIGNHNLNAITVVFSCSNNEFKNNKIGIGLDGLSQLPNGGVGIAITGTNTGNSIVRNTIYNNQKGVELNPALGIPTRVTISENSMYNNTAIGIDLVGTTANDADDADTGVNNLQNTPEITTVNRLAGTAMEITYSVPSSIANSAYPLTIEFFGAFSGQGKNFIESDIYTAVGTKTVTINLPTGFDPIDFVNVVATATDANGNTSEFGIQRDVTLSVLQNEIIGFKVYPNPVSNMLFIKSSISENYNLEVMNALGQIVSTKRGDASSTSLDVSNLSKGFYFLNIDSENGNSQTIKFIKN